MKNLIALDDLYFNKTAEGYRIIRYVYEEIDHPTRNAKIKKQIEKVIAVLTVEEFETFFRR